jgi:WD40 repeat protein
MRLWDPDTGTALGPPLTGHDDAVLAAQFELVSGVPALLTGGADGQRIWDPRTMTQVGEPNRTWQPSGTYCSLPDGRRLYAFGLPDFGLAVWDEGRRAPAYPPLRGHSGRIRAIAFGSASRPCVIATSGDDNTIRLWDALAGEPVGGPLEGHTGPVWGLSFAYLPTGRGFVPVLASAGSDGALRLWDPDTGVPADALPDDGYRASGWELPGRIDLGVPVYGVACAPPPTPPRLTVVTEAGVVALRPAKIGAVA